MKPKFLVRIPVNDRDGPYKCHQKVYEVCGSQPRPIWRRCPGYVIALAEKAPDGYQVKLYDPQPSEGRVTRFDLFAEVSVAKSRDGSTRSSRKDPILEYRFSNKAKSYAELARDIGGAWLAARGERLGFQVIDLEQADYEVIEFQRKGSPVRIGAVRFKGSLKVTNPGEFQKAMLEGVGHSKAWGLGFLLCFG